MRCSVVIPTYNKSFALQRVLEAVRQQRPPFDYEIIVVDDGSTDDTKGVCEHYGVQYHYLDRPYPCGPAKAKNLGYRSARGEIIFCMNDDAELTQDDAMERMCDLKPRTYNAAKEYRCDVPGVENAGMDTVVRLFFASTLARKHVWAVGGCDERFTMLNYEDTFMFDCLYHGRGVRCVRRDDVLVTHINHERGPEWRGHALASANLLYEQLCGEATRTGRWIAEGGPWDMESAP